MHLQNFDPCDLQMASNGSLKLRLDAWHLHKALFVVLRGEDNFGRKEIWNLGGCTVEGINYCYNDVTVTFATVTCKNFFDSWLDFA